MTVYDWKSKLWHPFRKIPNIKVQTFCVQCEESRKSIFARVLDFSDCLRNNSVKWPSHAKCRISPMTWTVSLLYTCRSLKWKRPVFDYLYELICWKKCDEDARNVTCPTPLTQITKSKDMLVRVTMMNPMQRKGRKNIMKNTFWNIVACEPFCSIWKTSVLRKSTSKFQHLISWPFFWGWQPNSVFDMTFFI